MPDGGGDRMAPLVGMADGTNSGKTVQKKVGLNRLTKD
jgi:hypothetical protein|tara:strand:+ start:808 stop:921 length:114 start_codon:yes stop_codon:yes gene_type:complete